MRRGIPNKRKQLVVPIERPQIHEKSAARVGGVGHVHTAVGAAGQVPDHPRVDIAEDGVAAFGGGP